jgi:hypothetical protein
VKLSTTDLRTFSKVLQRLDDGRISVPRVGGDVGMFLRQYEAARTDALAQFGLDSPLTGWISGDRLGELRLVPLTPLEQQMSTEIMGSVTTSVAISESLGTTIRVTLWGSARTANRALRTWRRDPTAVVSLRGPYRWHPPSRVTPGEANAQDTGLTLTWEHARCLKYTGDDVARAPHAAACHIDWSTGPPGIKAFRTVALRAGGGIWRALPGLRDARAGITFSASREALHDDCDQILALVCAEPWAAADWRVVAAIPAGDDDVLAHNIAWLDHLRELVGEPAASPAEIQASADRLRAAGLRPSVERAALLSPLDRLLSPQSRRFASWLRGGS